MRPARIWLATLLVGACSSSPGGSDSSEPPEPIAPVELDGATVDLRPNRDDVTIGRVTLILRCQKEPEGSSVDEPCDRFVINGAENDSSLFYVELEEVGPNRFELAPQVIDYSTEDEGYLCIAVKVSLAEVPNECDSDFYETRGDRYSMLSFCSAREHPDWANPHIFDFNRVETVEAFQSALSQGFSVELKSGPRPSC